MASTGKYSVLVFLGIVLCGAMILGPVLHVLIAPIVPIPFHRAMDRALLISAIVAMALYWKEIPLGKLWRWHREVWKPVLLGYVLAVVSAQAMMGLDLALSGFTLAPLEGSRLVSRIIMALVAAILVPPIEETIFRGFIQNQLVAALGWRRGWVLGAFIYMLAHFVKIPVEIDQQPVHPWSGIGALGAAFLPVGEGAFLCGRGVNLLLIGLILGGIYQRAGSLWIGAALHSGWIFSLLIFSGVTRPQEPPTIAFFGGDLLSTPVTTLVLIMLSLWLWRYYRLPSPEPEPGASAR